MPVAKAGRDVVVDQTRCLHVRIHDRTADELEAALFQIFAKRV
jgi:hypothetical protein